mmetsp:Transcript_22425/g.66784  ORF Transcript_22425/g.66784 Transcript_22425/m.66784 type:complete len:81 (+) Transcript_22425:1311-1553(+)
MSHRGQVPSTSSDTCLLPLPSPLQLSCSPWLLSEQPSRPWPPLQLSPVLRPLGSGLALGPLGSGLARGVGTCTMRQLSSS